MATFMDVHSGFFGVSAEQLQEAHERDLEIERDDGGRALKEVSGE